MSTTNAEPNIIYSKYGTVDLSTREFTVTPDMKEYIFYRCRVPACSVIPHPSNIIPGMVFERDDFQHVFCITHVSSASIRSILLMDSLGGFGEFRYSKGNVNLITRGSFYVSIKDRTPFHVIGTFLPIRYWLKLGLHHDDESNDPEQEQTLIAKGIKEIAAKIAP